MTSRLLVDKIEGKTTSGNIQMPAGHIVQTQTAQALTTTSISSTTFADVTGMSISFTSKFSSSKLLMIAQVHCYVENSSSGTWLGVDFRFLEDSTVIRSPVASGNGYGIAHAGGNDATTRIMDYAMFTHEHSSPDTSAHTYKLQVHTTEGNSPNAEINNNTYGGGGRLIIMEISQ